MISRLNAPFAKLFLNAGPQETPYATRQAFFVYVKPFLLATLITILLSFFIGVILLALAGWTSAAPIR
jgi:hypothetical protein